MSDATIVTLTLNPALDVSTSVAAVVPAHKLRCDRPAREPGGGGINVARVAERLGEPALAVLPLGGSPGARVDELLRSEPMETRIVPIAGETRESMSIMEENTGSQYRFVLPGPTLSVEEVEACKHATIEAATGCRCLVVSGSMPDGVDPAIFGDLVGALPDTMVIVDTSGSALRAALQSGAYLVKPSARELSNLVGRPLLDEAEIEVAARELAAATPVEVVVASIGAGGAIVVTSDGQSARLRAPTVQVRSAVGAGDSMVAGMAVGISRGLDLEDAVALGVAAGTAAVLTDGTELCSPGDIEQLLPIVARG